MQSFDTFLTKPLVVRGVFGPCGDKGASFAHAVPPKSRGAELTWERLLNTKASPKGLARAFPALLTLAASLKLPPEGAKSVAPGLKPGLLDTFGDLGV